MSQSKKASKILDNIKKNSKGIKAFDEAFLEKASLNRAIVLEKFIAQAGCYPSEAELVLEPEPHGDKTAWAIFLRPMDEAKKLSV